MLTLSRIVRLNRLSFAWQQAKVQFHMRAMRLFTFGLIVTQPVIFSAVGYFLARAAGRTNIDLIHTIIGSGVMGLWSTLLFTCYYDLQVDRREGILELLAGSPTPILTILAIRTLVNVLIGSLSFMLSLVIAFFVFGFSLPSENLPYILVSLVVLFFSFWCIGLLLAHWPVVSRLSGLFINYLELPIGMLTGFMFPVTLLPSWAKLLSFFTPMVWAFNSVAESFQNNVDISYLWRYWIMALTVSFLYLIISFFMSKRVRDMIRVTGELSSV